MFEESTNNSFVDAGYNTNRTMKNSSNNEFTNREDSIISEFTVKITNHKKVSSFLETFLVYSIETSGDIRPHLVERRYNDFQWLHQRLIERYPMAIVPPLPSKHNLTAIERFSGTFIDQRREALDKFLQRIVEHHILGVDKEFWSFLTLLPTMFQELKRSRPVLGKVESLLQSIQNLSVVASVSTSDHSIADAAGFHKLVDDSAKLADVMTALGRVVRRTEDVWDNIASTVPNDGTLKSDEWGPLTSLGLQCGQTASVVRHQVEPWVVESALYWGQLEQVARRRNDAEARFVASVAKQARAQDANVAKKEANKFHDVLSQSNADLTSELDRFRAQRRAETGDWLRRLADLHVEHYRRTSQVWRQMVASVSEPALD